MNKPRLRAVAARIVKRPDKYLQIAFCGTKCCIGGHAVLAFGSKDDKRNFAFGRADLMFHAGRKALGLTTKQADRLFVRAWPDAFEPAWDSSVPAKQRARLAAARIRHFIATEGRE